MPFSRFRSFLLSTRSFVGALFVSFFFLFSFSYPAFAATGINHAFSYQGRLYSAGGSLVADGTYAMKFSLYDSAGGGTRLWTAAGTTVTPTTVNVTVTNGLFSVSMGDIAAGQNALNIDWNQDSLYLGVTVGTDSEMSPRKRLTAVPYAFNAEALQGNYASSSISSLGGNLMTLHQVSGDVASAARTALFVQTNGTSNVNDYLVKGNNGTSDVFTINRLGNTTTTGNLAVNGSTTLGDNATTDLLAVNAHLLTDLTPWADVSVKLGTGANRWLSLDAQTVNGTTFNGTTYNGTTFSGTTVSSTNGLFATATSTNFAFTSASGSTLLIGGKQVCLADGTNCIPVASTSTLQDITTLGASTTHLIAAFGGVATSNLTATGTTSLQGTTFTNATGTNLAFASGTSTNWFGFTTASGTNLNVSNLLVNGSSVCLLSGINCPSVSLGPIVWQDDAMNNIVSLTTSTRALLFGGNTTSTAGFIWNPSGALTGTSSVMIGAATNTNLLVGASDYTGGLDPNFSLSGKDVFVRGMVGSLGGIYSATSVVVGPSSTVYGDGSITKTNGDLKIQANSLLPGTDGTINFGNATSSWRDTYIGGTQHTSSGSYLSSVQANTNILVNPSFETPGTFDPFESWLNFTFPGSTVTATTTNFDGATGAQFDVGAGLGPLASQAQTVSTVNGNTYTLSTYAQGLVGGETMFFAVQDSLGQYWNFTGVSAGTFTNVLGHSLQLPNDNVFACTLTTSFTRCVVPPIVSDDTLLTLHLLGGNADPTYSNQSFVVDAAQFELGSTASAFVLPTPKTAYEFASAATSGAFTPADHVFDFSMDSGATSMFSMDGNGLITQNGTGIQTNANRTDYSINIPVTGADVQTHTLSLQLAGSNGLSIVANGDGAGGITPIYVGLGQVGGTTHIDGAVTNNEVIYANEIQASKIDSALLTQGGVGVCLNDGLGCPVSPWIDNGIDSVYLATSSRMLGVGTSTPAEALDVVGNIRNTLVQDQSFVITTSTTSLVDGAPQHIRIQGSYAYVINQTTGSLQVFDISNTVQTKLVGSLGSLGNVTGLFVAGPYAYIVNDTQLTIVDISNPALPHLTSSFIEGQASDVFVSGHYAYVSTPFNGLNIYNIADPFHITSVVNVPFATAVNQTVVDGNTAYVVLTNANEIQAFNVSDPTQPQLVSTTSFVAPDAPVSVAVSGHYLYVTKTGTAGRLQVFDVSDPTAPVAHDQIIAGDGGYVGSVTVAGRYAYFSTSALNDVSVIDVSNPDHLVLIQMVRGAGGTDSALSGKTLFTVDQWTNLFAALDVRGVETNGLSAESARIGLLRVTGDGSVERAFTVGGGLVVGAGGIQTQGSLSAGSGFLFDPGTSSGTSTLYLGATTNTNVLIGTSAYAGGLDPNFALSGKDLFVQGQIGSLGGLYSATSVVVGNSSFYNDGSIIKDTAGDFTVALNDGSSSFNVMTGGSTSTAFTVSSKGRVGIGGVTKPTAALEVAGGISSTMVAGQTTYRVAATDDLAGSLVGPRGSFIVGTTEYIADTAGSALDIVNISLPEDPALIEHFALPGGSTPEDVYVSGNYAYVTDDSLGQLYTIDISNPLAPRPVSTMTLSEPNRIVASGQTLFIADFSGFLESIDISQPSAPVLLQKLSIPSGVFSVAVRDNVAYVTAGLSFNSVETIDVTDPRAMFDLGSVGVGTFPTGITISGSYAFVADNYDNRVTVLNLSDARLPFAETDISIGGSPWGITTIGNALITANSDGSASVVDISFPTKATLIQDITSTVGGLRSVISAGRYAHLMADSGKMLILDMNGLEVNGIHAGTASLGNVQVQNNADIVGHLNVGTAGDHASGLSVLGGTQLQGAINNSITAQTKISVVTSTNFSEPLKMRISGSYGYDIDGFDGKLHVLGLSGQGGVTDLGSVVVLPGGTKAMDLAVQGSYAYVIDNKKFNQRLWVVDITKPTQPVNVTNLILGGNLSSVTVSGKYAYVTNMSAGTMYVVDISNPASPTLANTVSGFSSPSAVTIIGNRAYVGDFDGLKIVDVTNPVLATVVGSAFGSFKDFGVAASGRYAYVGNSSGIDVFDVASSSVPVLVNTMFFNGVDFPAEMTIQGSTMYVAGENGNLEVFDISNPLAPAVGGSSPQFVQSVGVASVPLGVVVKGHYAYISDPDNGAIVVVDVGGIETNAIRSGSADLGQLQVGLDAHIGNNLSVGGELTVGGKTVCLADGTNCPVGGSIAGPSVITTYGSVFGGLFPESVATFGKTAITVGDDADEIEIFDTTTPDSPATLSRLVLSEINPLSVVTDGKYAYVGGTNTGLGNGRICTVDVSNPESMVDLGCAAPVPGTEAYPHKLQLVGKYLYSADYAVANANVMIYDVSDPLHLHAVGEYILDTSWPIGMKVQDGYLYTLSFDHYLDKVDLSDPTNPASLGSVNVGGDYGTDLDVSGNLAYVLRHGIDSGTSELTSVDVAFNGSGAVIQSVVMGDNPRSILISGRYAYVTGNTNKVQVYDIQDPTAMTLVTTLTAQTGASALALEGRMLYVANTNSNSISLIDIGGTEVSGLIAHSAELGSLTVLGDGSVKNQFTVGGGLTVGQNGISTLGSLSVSSLNTTSTFAYGLSAANGSFSRMLQVGGVSVCLQDGTNCPTGSGSSNWNYSTSTDTLSTTTSTSNVMVGGNVINGIVAGHAYPTMSTTTLASHPLGIAMSGSYAYVTNVSSNSLSIVDTSNSESPTVVSTISVGTAPADVKLHGHYAYVANATSDDVTVVDITHPASPSVVVAVPVGTGPNSLAIDGNDAYVANTSSNTVSILDLTNPAAPVVVSTVSVGTGPDSISVSDHHVYVANHGSTSISIIDVTNPKAPVVVATPTVGVWPYWVTTSGRYAYVANAGSGTMSVLDITTPASPSVVTTTAVGSFPSSITISGKYAYVVNHLTNSLHIFDVSDPTSPVLIDVPSGFGNGPYNMVVSGRYGYFPSYFADALTIVDLGGVETNGLKAASAELGSLTVSVDGFVGNSFRINNALSVGSGGIETSGPILASDHIVNLPSAKKTFSTVKTVSGLTDAHSVAIQGKYAYVANDSGNSLSILDISDPTNATVVTSTTVNGGPYSVAVAGRYAFTANETGNSVSVVDISNPMAANVVATVAVGARPTDIVISGRYVYTANYNGNSVSVIDVSSSTAPFVANTLPLASFPNPDAITVSGRYGYVPNWTTHTMTVVDFIDPTSPSVATTTQVLNHPAGVSVQGKYAYIASYDGGPGSSGAVEIMDVSDPTSPVYVSTAALSAGPQQIFVSGRYAYTPDYASNSVSIVDIASSTAPFEVGTAAVGGHPLQVVAAGQFLYSANASGNSVSIVDLGGMETNALTAASAQIGSLQVLSNATVSNDFTVMGSLDVGTGGILSQGQIGISASTVGAHVASITNTAANTVAVMDISGACSNSDAATDLFLIGNSTDQRKFSVRCNGDVHIDGAYTSTGADFAEYFAGDAAHLPVIGDVVRLTGGSTSTIQIGSSSLRDQVLGVVSTKPGFIGNGSLDGTTSTVIVGLLGQIPTHASASSSAIAAGDWLMAGDDGLAVKAQGPGMVIGRAIDPLASGTGMIQVAVHPQWWAGDLFVGSASGAQQMHDITASSDVLASIGTTLVNSPAYTFRGSAWDTDTSLPIVSSFSLFTAPQSATTSLFTIASTSGTPVLTISDLGDASVSRDLTVGGRLFLGSNSTHAGSTSTYLFADESVPRSTFISTNADGFQTSSTYDYAERYVSHEDLLPGDVVTADASGVNVIRRATSTMDVVLGIVSTRPGFVTGAYATSTYPVALAGRVPTRVSTKNGGIHVGDTLSASDIPGVAVKAIGSVNTVGVALESYDLPDEGLISVFVKTGWQGAPVADTAPTSTPVTVMGSVRSGLAKVYAGSTSVKVTFPTMSAFPIIQATPYGEAKGGYWFSDVSDSGFTITLANAPTFDLLFAWTVQPSTSGANIYFSDNTSASYDPLTGNTVPVAPAPAVTSTPDVSATTTTSDTTTTTTP